MPAFTVANAAEAARKSQAARGSRKELHQALELQDLAYKAARSMCSGPSLGETLPREHAMALASLLKGWDSITNRVRILRGKPLPGSKRPAPDQAQAARRVPPRNRPPVCGGVPGGQ
jgi:hypothetical protein